MSRFITRDSDGTYLEEIEKKDKIIDYMAEYIANLDIEEDICMKNIANTNLCNEDYTKCKECVIKHFNQKIEKDQLLKEEAKTALTLTIILP